MNRIDKALILKQLIAQNKLKKAIEQLLESCDSQDSKLYDMVIQLAGEQKQVHQEEIQGLLSASEQNVKANRLRNKLLNLINLWVAPPEDNTASVDELAETKKREVQVLNESTNVIRSIFLRTVDFRVNEKYFVIENEAKLGRSKECEVVINHPHVSRVHARLYLENGKAHLEDLNSSNGTYIDGKRINSKVKISQPLSFQVDEVQFFVNFIHEPTR